MGINLRATMIHLLGDLLQSVGVVIASIVIYFYPNFKIIDSLWTFLFALIVIVTTISILK